jgi:hypothetical protein
MKHMPEWLFRKIQRLLHEDDINEILTKYADLQGLDFINAVVADFNLDVVLDGVDNLMASDRILVASNHPLGGLDGIALISVVVGHVLNQELGGTILQGVRVVLEVRQHFLHLRTVLTRLLKGLFGDTVTRQQAPCP